jgi:hypothetical protein
MGLLLGVTLGTRHNVRIAKMDGVRAAHVTESLDDDAPGE